MTATARSSLRRGEKSLCPLPLPLCIDVECSERKEQLRSKLKTTTFQKINTHQRWRRRWRWRQKALKPALMAIRNWPLPLFANFAGDGRERNIDAASFVPWEYACMGYGYGNTFASPEHLSSYPLPSPCYDSPSANEF